MVEVWSVLSCGKCARERWKMRRATNCVYFSIKIHQLTFLMLSPCVFPVLFHFVLRISHTKFDPKRKIWNAMTNVYRISSWDQRWKVSFSNCFECVIGIVAESRLTVCLQRNSNINLKLLAKKRLQFTMSLKVLAMRSKVCELECIPNTSKWRRENTFPQTKR